MRLYHALYSRDSYEYLEKKKSIPILAVKSSDDIAIESLRSIRTAIHFALTTAKIISL